METTNNKLPEKDLSLIEQINNKIKQAEKLIFEAKEEFYLRYPNDEPIVEPKEVVNEVEQERWKPKRNVMENNPLLEALKVNKEKSYPLNSYLLENTNDDILAHILDLLDRQRQKCAEEAELKLHGIAGNYIDKESITEAKLT